MKRIVKLVSIIFIVIMMITSNVKAFTMDPRQEISIVYDDKVPYHYGTEEKQNYKILEYGDTVFYLFNQEHNIVMLYMTNQQTYTDPVCKKILENGYPFRTYEQLGVADEKEAYLATQEAIFVTLENKNINQYVAENEKGERILKATRNILEKMKQEEVSFIQLDEKWQVNLEDENYMYKQFQIKCKDNIENLTIKLQEAKDCKILSEANHEISSLKNGDIVKILVPNNKNQTFQAVVSYQRNGVELFRCFNSTQADTKYLVGDIRKETDQTSFEISYQELATVSINNYDHETKQQIASSKFRIYDIMQEIIQDNLTTDENGNVQIPLKKGEYYLKQTEVPNPYSLSTHLIKFTIKDNEKVSLNVYNSELKIEETSTQHETQVNIEQENKQIQENHVTDVTNITASEIEKEITYTTNETNLKNVNYYNNTTHLKNIRNIMKENVYNNEMWKKVIKNEEIPGDNVNAEFTKEEYVTFVNNSKNSNLQVSNLPVALNLNLPVALKQ